MQNFGYNTEGLGFQDGRIARRNHCKFSEFTKLKKRQKAKENVFIRYKEKYLYCKGKCKAKVKRNARHCEPGLLKASWYKINMSNAVNNSKSIELL